MEYDYLKVRHYYEREEIDLDGKHYYVLSFDNKQHIKVSKAAKIVIEQFNGERKLDDIIAVLGEKQINVCYEDLSKFVKNILVKNNMLDNETCTNNRNKNKSKLWVHIPVIESSRFNLIYRGAKCLFNKYVFVILMALVVCIESYNIFECFIIKQINSNQINSLTIIALTFLSLFIHELGHISAAFKFNIKSGKIGIGVYLIYLVFFVDMTNVWRLDKNERVLVDIAGMYFQLICIIPIFAVYLITGDPSYMISTILILGITLINLMPFLKLDGYWILSDYLSIQNVDVKAFKSIKNLFTQLVSKFKYRNTDNNIEISRGCLVCGIYSFIYVVITTIMICYMMFLCFAIVADYNSIIAKFIVTGQNILSGDYNKALINLNNIIIIIIPLISLIYMAFSVVHGFLKGVINGIRMRGIKGD